MKEGFLDHPKPFGETREQKQARIRAMAARKEKRRHLRAGSRCRLEAEMATETSEACTHGRGTHMCMRRKSKMGRQVDGKRMLDTYLRMREESKTECVYSCM